MQILNGSILKNAKRIASRVASELFGWLASSGREEPRTNFCGRELNNSLLLDLHNITIYQSRCEQATSRLREQ